MSPAARQIKWMFIVAIAPEIAVATAIEDWANAKESYEDMATREEGWTMTHGFFAGMGGIAIRLGPLDEPIPLYAWQVSRLRNPAWRPPRQRYFSGEAGQNLREEGPNEILPALLPGRVPLEEIKDRSKADILVKGLAVVQAGWLVVQTIVRRVQSLPISQLELATSAFVLCAITMYWFWLDKPYCINNPTVIDVNQGLEVQINRAARAQGEPNNTQRILDYLEESTKTHYGPLGWKLQNEDRRISNLKNHILFYTYNSVELGFPNAGRKVDLASL
ncbi:hypothetical protein G7Y89_g1830 [Cudoniella acicularis]|uniref:Uncharacterized protein n=1 Tax=Cudoniella acicularis TaxID=354080 RepID=A0A8H4RUG7_9HELO|nr:hypothetical protein G7Y89_g1830 [Cudoniella acicularis]